MSERKWTRRTWEGRLEILNYQFTEKAVMTHCSGLLTDSGDILCTSTSGV